MGLIPGMKALLNTYQSISMIYHINKLKDKNHMTIISIDAEKAFNKIKYPFMIKTYQKVGIEETYLNMGASLVTQDSQESACNAGDLSLTPVSGRSPRERNGYSLQSSCLQNSMDRGTWKAIVHGVTKSQTRLSG